jgi:membrane protein implicated in regulation of membrane protease activity
MLVVVFLALVVLVAIVFMLPPSERHSSPQQNVSGLVGARGVAEESFSTEGRVLVQGELWRATSARGIVQRGDPVVVEEVRPGLLLVVSPLGNDDRTPTMS